METKTRERQSFQIGNLGVIVMGAALSFGAIGTASSCGSEAGEECSIGKNDCPKGYRCEESCSYVDKTPGPPDRYLAMRDYSSVDQQVRSGTYQCLNVCKKNEN